MSYDELRLRCCEPMMKAQEAGTDSGAYGTLIQFVRGEIEIGYNLPPITFCPWCGKKIEKKL